MQLENLVRVNLIGISEENGWDRKNEGVQKKVTPAVTHIKQNFGDISRY